MEGLRSCLGRVHEDTLTCMNNLAAVLEAQGGHDEAEALYKEVLAWRKLGLGLHHVKTLTSATSLACLCEIRGRHKEAEKLCVLAHKATMRALSADAEPPPLKKRDRMSAVRRDAKDRRRVLLSRTLRARSRCRHLGRSLGPCQHIAARASWIPWARTTRPP